MTSLRSAIGFLETTGSTPAMVALDAMEKSASISVLQAEINDFLGIVIKIEGSIEDVDRALEAGEQWARRLHGDPITHRIAKPAEEASGVLVGPDEYNPLIEQSVVFRPATFVPETSGDESMAAEEPVLALGFIETQGFTAVFDAIDTACKAANVEVLGKEKLGGGYVTVIVQGDVAAVHTAIEAGQARVEGLGKLIAAHVIPRPSDTVRKLLPQ